MVRFLEGSAQTIALWLCLNTPLAVHEQEAEDATPFLGEAQGVAVKPRQK